MTRTDSVYTVGGLVDTNATATTTRFTTDATEHRIREAIRFPFDLLRQDDNGDGLTLEGYASVFNSFYDIDSWEGTFREQIARGAFRKTIKERGSKVALMYDHGQHPLVGEFPLGRITELREDDHGLLVRARLHETWLVEPVREAIRSGAIKGMSFRFSVIKDEWDHETNEGIPERTIKEVALHEVGPVGFPANDATEVALRALVGRIGDTEVRNALKRSDSDTTDDRAISSPGDTQQDEAVSSEEPSGSMSKLDARKRLAKINGVLP